MTVVGRPIRHTDKNLQKGHKKDLFQDLWDDLLPNKTDWLAQRKNLLGKFTPDLVRSLLLMNQAAKVGRL